TTAYFKGAYSPPWFSTFAPNDSGSSHFSSPAAGPSGPVGPVAPVAPVAPVGPVLPSIPTPERPMMCVPSRLTRYAILVSPLPVAHLGSVLPGAQEKFSPPSHVTV